MIYLLTYLPLFGTTLSWVSNAIIFFIQIFSWPKPFRVWTQADLWRSLSSFQNVCGHCSQLCGKTCPFRLNARSNHDDSWLWRTFMSFGYAPQRHGDVRWKASVSGCLLVSEEKKSNQRKPQHGRAASE